MRPLHSMNISIFGVVVVTLFLIDSILIGVVRAGVAGNLPTPWKPMPTFGEEQPTTNDTSSASIAVTNNTSSASTPTTATSTPSSSYIPPILADSPDDLPAGNDTSSNYNSPFVYGTGSPEELDYQNYILSSLNYYLSIASIAGGSVVLAVIASMWLYDRKLVNRVSLRLTSIISVVDILNAVAIIFYTNYSGGDTNECTAIGWAMSFLPQAYLFLTVMIAFNLQLVFLHRKKITRFSDKWYIPVAFMAAIAINLPPLILKRFGYDETAHDCLYRDSQSITTLYWEIFTFIAPVVIAMVYCTVVLVIVVFKIVFENRRLAETIQTASVTVTSKAKKQKLLVLRLVSRISLYACIPVLSVGGIVVLYIWVFVTNNNSPFWVQVWAVVGSCLPGSFNCIAFLCDPAIHNAIRKVKRDLISSYGYDDQLVAASKPVFSPPSSPRTPVTPSPYSPRSPHLMPPNSGRMSTVRDTSDTSGFYKEKKLSCQFTKNKKGTNKFMKWFVRVFLAPRQRSKEPPLTISSPSVVSSLGYYTPNSNESLLQRDSYHQPARFGNNNGSTRPPGGGGHTISGRPASSKVYTESTLSSSYTTFDSRRTSNSVSPFSARYSTMNDLYDHYEEYENPVYSQYYYPDLNMDSENSRPSSSIGDDSEWEEFDVTAL